MADKPALFEYLPHMTRRQSLKWLGAMAASAALPGITGCATKVRETASLAGHWPETLPLPITARGYGKDPNLIMPVAAPWPLTLSGEQRNLVAWLADVIIPREGAAPSATDVGVPDVIDEWVSAPYERQQQDRNQILPFLTWLDDEAELRGQQRFSALPTDAAMAIIDDIAFEQSSGNDVFTRPAEAFSRLRSLVLAAYFCSPQGTKEIGYMGNVAIAGDYPGPTPAASEHLDDMLASLGLSEYAWQGNQPS